MFHRLIVIAMLVVLLGATLALAQDEALPPADLVQDEGGTQLITGTVSYTNAFFTAGVAEPLIILEDEAGFVDRNRGFILPPESQVLGQITSDFLTSPFTYTLQLPIEPQGTLRDVDNDGETDSGVQIFGIAYWTNIWGPSFLEERDLGGGGWSTAYASMRVSNRSESLYEVTGGTYLIFAPDDQQGFPSGFGDDGKLFTEDDPAVRVPQGYTLVNMDTTPFTFDRSQHAVVDLIEGEGAEADDFSSLSYTAAFDAMIEKFRKEYAFTEYKHIDWDAKSAEFRPRFVEAEANNDPTAYEFALQAFVWSIPDGHIQMSSTLALNTKFREETAGGVGIAIRELDDGRTIVNYLTDGGPAAEAGIELRAQILDIDNRPVDEVVSEIVPWSSPFSAPDRKRLQQLRYATRFVIGDEVSVTYQNPGDSEPTTVTLTAVDEPQSFSFSSFNRGLTGYDLPVEYNPIDGTDYVIVRLTDFLDNERLTIDLWERFINAVNSQGVPGIIIDMRNNGGGNPWLAAQMAAYFFDQPLDLGNRGQYDEDTGEFFFDPNQELHFVLPPENMRYQGQIAVLVGPNCSSACESFSYDMSIADRSAIVGQYTTSGLGGGIEQFFMPDGMSMTMTVVRSVDANGNIHIEDKGVAPTVRVPVDEETLFSDGDPVLDTAIAHLDSVLAVTMVDGGALQVGDEITADIQPNTRVQYALTLPGGRVTSIYLESANDAMDPVLNLYSADGATLLANNDDADETTLNAALEDLEVGADDFDVIVEVATVRDGDAGTYTLRVVDVTDAAEATLEPAA
ncbi:MAG: peptidase S41 [Anaerolineae bacterium]|nr:peptidase S41 [Anaerolineae bacterium]